MEYPVEFREKKYRGSEWTKENRPDGQAIFPNEKLGISEVTPCNPWRINKIPLQPIKLYVKGKLII